jgi:hypothetical protein
MPAWALDDDLEMHNKTGKAAATLVALRSEM